MIDLQRFASWSLPLGSVAGIAIRVHWTLLLLMVFESVRTISHLSSVPDLAWWGIALTLPLLLLIPFVSVLLHEFGHSFMARLVGGSSNQIIMWMFGGLAMCHVPPHWGKQFAVAAAGPMVTFVLMAGTGLWLGSPTLDPSYSIRFISPPTETTSAAIMWSMLAYTANINLLLLLFNLLPAYPLDGGRIMRSLLWPVFGLRTAVTATIFTAYAVLTALLILAVVAKGVFFALLVVILFFAVYQEHQLLRRGVLVDGESLELDHATSWWTRRSRARQQVRRDRERAAEEARQERLDQLLAKVSAHGLPSLTEEERRFLKDYSARERHRSGRFTL